MKNGDLDFLESFIIQVISLLFLPADVSSQIHKCPSWRHFADIRCLPYLLS